MRKFDSETKYQIKKWVFTAVCVVLVFLALQNIGWFLSSLGKLMGIVTPFFIGFAIAFVLNSPLKMLERHLSALMDKNPKLKKFKRPVALLLTYLLFFLIIAFVVSLLVPQVAASVKVLVANVPSYLNQLQNTVNTLSQQYGIGGALISDVVGSWEEILKQAGSIISSALPQVMNITMSVTAGVSNFFIGIIVSIYMLADKERFSAQLKRVLGAYLPPVQYGHIMHLGDIAYKTFNGFISGQILDACIVGFLCFIGMNILPLSPAINTYMVLISTIIAITNIIPIFGPYIGAVPCTFIILMVDFKSALWFVAMIIAIQMVDGNIILPKIVGDSIGLSGFWVMLSIIAGGGLFGLIGMVLGIPTFATFYKVMQLVVDKRVASKRAKGEPDVWQRHII
ncbi:MAG: AI-2E family transporter [Hydrogenoanaerobacterium sp.]